MPAQASFTPVQASIFSLGLYFIFTALSYLGSLSFYYHLKRCKIVTDITRFKYDPIAKTYDKQVHKANSGLVGMDYFWENYFEIQRRVIELAALQPGMKVLDIGFGTGLMWEDITVSVDLHGLDISEGMLTMAAKKGIRVSLRQGHFLDLPYPPSSFDRIVSTFAFHYVPPEDKARAFEHMARVLVPDGHIVIGDAMFRNDIQRMDVINRLRQEKRQDIISTIEQEYYYQEYYTDIEALEASIAPLGLNLECQRGSTLSWIIKVTRSLPTPSLKHSHNFVKQ
jgi:ubiquinone/menaquinone biosynthesis C-methylase UbiE